MSSRSKPFRSTSLWLALLVSGGGLAIAGTALAQGWGTYEKAFPSNPCHDGWSACIVDGERVTPDMTGKGPADMRVDWFDLEPSTAFSPFTGLTEYTGEVAVAAAEEPAVADAGDGGAIEESEDDGVASAPSAESVEAERKADEAAMEEDAARAAEEEARREQEEAQKAQKKAAAAAAAAQKEEAARRREAERMQKEAEQQAAAATDAAAKAAAEAKRKEAEQARKAAEEAERKRKQAERQEAEQRAAEEAAQKRAAEEERKRQEAEAAAKAAEAEARRQAEEDRKRREAEEAERKAEADRLAAEKAAADAKAAEEAAAAGDGGDDGAAAVETAPPPAMDDGSCDNLQSMEPPAMLGKMSDGQVSCLEGKLSASMKMTEKKKISVLLMTNAFSKGDKAKWEELVKRHLDEIDQSDPDLCYKYALYLAGKGSSRASGVIRWANVALENRTVWTGDTYKSRVNSLFKMRAAASQKLWQSAEKEHAASPSEATSSKIEKYRNMTKVNAREWYEYAKVSGKDTTKPLQLCMSAAGTSDYCDGG